MVDDNSGTAPTNVTSASLDPTQEWDPNYKAIPPKMRQFLLFDAELNWNTIDVLVAKRDMGWTWAQTEEYLRHADRGEYQLAYPTMGVANPFKEAPTQQQKHQYYDVLW